MATPVTKRRRLAGLSIKETSGVDRAANRSQVGGDGWMVMKQDGTPFSAADVAAYFPAAAEAQAEAELRAVVSDAQQTLSAAKALQPRRSPATAASGVKEEPPMPRPSVATKSSARAAIEKAAADFRRARAIAGEAVTREQAIAKVTELDPSLVDAFREALDDPTPPQRPAPTLTPSPHVARLDAHVEELAKRRGITKADAYGDLDAQGYRLLAVVKQAQGRHHDAKAAREYAERMGG